MNANPHVAIVGATGAVGKELLGVLDQRRFPLSRLTLLASARSAGSVVDFRGEKLTVQELREDSFVGVDIALFSAGGNISRKFGPIASAAGAVVVDNSSAFRMDPDTPLVIPEINPEDAKQHRGIIANPNCSTIILLMVAAPIHRLNPIKKIVVSTYQAASGAGAVAMKELETQARDHLEGREVKPEVFPYPIAFNAFSHNSKYTCTGFFSVIIPSFLVLYITKNSISEAFQKRLTSIDQQGISNLQALKEHLDTQFPDLTEKIITTGFCIIIKVRMEFAKLSYEQAHQELKDLLNK